MRFYRRYSSDGSCVVICTHCFATLGQAGGFAAASNLEAQHVCGRRLIPDMNTTALEIYALYREPEKRFDGLAGFLGGLERKSAAALFVLIALAVYGLPNMVEFVALGHASPWVVNILFGDLTGCLCLGLILRMPRTGVVLYVVLSLLEGWFLATGRVAPGTLAWITDAIPTVVVVGRVAQLRVGAESSEGQSAA